MQNGLPQAVNESTNFRFLQRLSVIFGFRQDCPWSLASCRDYCPWNMASCRDSQQEAKSHGQSLQEAISQAQQPRQEVRDHGQSRWKPNMTDSLCRKRKLVDSFIPCVYSAWDFLMLWDAAARILEVTGEITKLKIRGRYQSTIKNKSAKFHPNIKRETILQAAKWTGRWNSCLIVCQDS